VSSCGGRSFSDTSPGTGVSIAQSRAPRGPTPPPGAPATPSSARTIAKAPASDGTIARMRQSMPNRRRRGGCHDANVPTVLCVAHRHRSGCTKRSHPVPEARGTANKALLAFVTLGSNLRNHRRSLYKVRGPPRRRMTMMLPFYRVIVLAASDPTIFGRCKRNT
jgi:hypothetical protein